MWKIFKAAPIFLTSVDQVDSEDTLMYNNPARVEPYMWF